MSHEDDETTARVFHTLADPMSLKLILHLLDVGECDRTVGRQLQMTRRAGGVRLDRLLATGLIVGKRDAETSLYELADAASVERLLATVRQLGTR